MLQKLAKNYFVSVIPGFTPGYPARTPFGLMQICSRQICAGQIGRTADLHWPEGQCTRMYIVNPDYKDVLNLPSHTTTLRTGHGTGYPLPGEYGGLFCFSWIILLIRTNYGAKMNPTYALKPWGLNNMTRLRLNSLWISSIMNGNWLIFHGRNVRNWNVSCEAMHPKIAMAKSRKLTWLQMGSLNRQIREQPCGCLG